MFYDRYLELCNEKGVSPSKAALSNGISKTSVTRWKDGAVPNPDILSSFASYFNVSIDYLLGNTDIKKEPAPKIGDELFGEEAKILKLFRAAPPELKAAALGMLEAAEKARLKEDSSLIEE